MADDPARRRSRRSSARRSCWGWARASTSAPWSPRSTLWRRRHPGGGRCRCSCYRFAAGLGATTHLSQAYPWGLWIGFDMMTGIVLAAGGFTIGAAVQLFGLKDYHAIERPAILTAFLGYVMAVFGLLADLGRPWNIVQALFHYGTASVLFEVAWCVMCYTHRPGARVHASPSSSGWAGTGSTPSSRR